MQHRLALPLLFLLSLAQRSPAQDYLFDAVPTRDVIAALEQTTAYSFLYRDALIAGTTLSFSADSTEALSAFSAALASTGLVADIDSSRKQIVIVERARSSQTVIRGVVLDDVTSRPLPYATIMWKAGEQTRGVAADASGSFAIELGPGQSLPVLRASYVGYRPRDVRLSVSSGREAIPVRLVPEAQLGTELVITAPVLQTELDTAWHQVLASPLFSPLGESNVFRALQILPSVGPTAALSTGLNVRGTRADGFQVLLDGVPVYNQTHFFGMFDAFNPEALSAVDFYYSVAPARLQGPPGGTISFLTKPGSRSQPAGQVNLTNTSLSSTVEGPLSGGKGSWLLSSRGSYMSVINWFNNEALISQGLDVGRPNSGPPSPGPGARSLFRGDNSAVFFDVHAKLFHETAPGAQLQISSYVGGDKTRQEATRLLPSSPSDLSSARLQPVETDNDWGNVVVSIQDRRPAAQRTRVTSTLGFTRYYSDFHKDDYLYRLRPASGRLPLVLAPFRNENRLTEVKLSTDWSHLTGTDYLMHYGLSLHRYGSAYNELSTVRQAFESSEQSFLADLYWEQTAAAFDILTTALGVRMHYYSAGSFLRLSPRVRFHFLPQHRTGFSVAYSRSYQFLHRLYLDDRSSSDVWVLSNEEQPPGYVDHVTGGVKTSLAPKLLLQIDGYAKWHRNLRRHQTVFRPSGIRDESVLLSPWVADNLLRTYGVESMLRFSSSRSQASVAMTVSRSEIRHPEVNQGDYFLADWDRPLSFTAHYSTRFLKQWAIDASWVIATGEPNALSFQFDHQPSRLTPYHRLDAGVTHSQSLSGAHLLLAFRLFNVYNRNNVWYRKLDLLLQDASPQNRLTLEPVDVYDLGLHPSFQLRLSF